VIHIVTMMMLVVVHVKVGGTTRMLNVDIHTAEVIITTAATALEAGIVWMVVGGTIIPNIKSIGGEKGGQRGLLGRRHVHGVVNVWLLVLLLYRPSRKNK